MRGGSFGGAVLWGAGGVGEVRVGVVRVRVRVGVRGAERCITA